MARLTGERPMAGATPDSLLAFHDAGYREMADRLGSGVVLDVGGGVGDRTARLAGIGRPGHRVDYHALHADFAQRRASGEKLVRLDPFDLRHKMPHRWYVWGYERVLPVVYKALGSSRTGIGSGIDESNFFLTDQIPPSTPGLFAVARNP